MSNDILDEAEKYTGARTCPECGFQYPLRDFVRRYIRSYGLPKWSCHSCGTLLTSDFIKVQMIWLFGILLTGVLCGVANSYVDLGVFNIIFVILYFAFALRTLYYVKFEKSE